MAPGSPIVEKHNRVPTVLAALAVLAVVAAAIWWFGIRDSEGSGAGLANPAAVFCEEQGGIVSGVEPMCELPDGTMVDAWGTSRHRTNPAPRPARHPATRRLQDAQDVPRSGDECLWPGSLYCWMLGGERRIR
jgi:putative hemolysin